MERISCGLPLKMHRACNLFLLAGIVSAMPRSLEEEGCTVGDAAGVCQRLSSCPSVQAAIGEGSAPVRCGFIGKEEVVCCPKEKSHSRVRQIRVSQQKCRYYTDLYQQLPVDYVINGTSAEEAEFPHMAALGYRLQGKKDLTWACAGSLISEQFVLTAAHCLTTLGKPVRVQLGVNDLQSQEGAISQYDVDQKNVIIYPEFKKPYNDVALIKLTKKVILSTYISPVCLYDASGDPPGLLTVAGWGATNVIGTRLSSTLLKTSIQAVPKSQCENVFKSEFTRGVDNSVICAGDPKGQTDTCQGDSGGPLQIKEDGITFIVGITSFGKMPCGSPVGIYVRVSNFIDWIEKKVWA